MNTIIITDSSSDLSLDFVRSHEKHLIVLGMPVNIADREYVDDLGDTFSHTFFYEQLDNGTMPKTSQINVMTFYECFKKQIENDNEIIYIGLSSGLSGTVGNAFLAADMVKEDYPEASIHIIDSLAASIGLAALVIEAVHDVEKELETMMIFQHIESIKLQANHWFVVDDLMHLKNGGRIPAASAYVGTMLSVKPVLSMDHRGKLVSFSKLRGKAKAYKYMLNKVMENLSDDKQMIVVGHAHLPEEAERIIESFRAAGITNPVIVTCLSATIASHVGPGMMAIAFISNSIREDR